MERNIKIRIDPSGAKRGSSQVQSSLGAIRDRASRADTTMGKFRSTLRGMGRLLPGLGSALATVGGIGGLGMIAKNSLQATEELARFRDVTGESVEWLQNMEFAASQFNVEQDRFRDGIMEMVQLMGEAATEGGEMAEGFEMAGLNIQSLTDMRPSEVFREVAKAVSEANSEAEAMSMTAKIFGDETGRDMMSMMSEGTDAIDEYTQKAQEMGYALSNEAIEKGREASRTLSMLADVVRNNVTSAFAELAPDIARVVKEITSDPEQIEEFAENLARVAQMAGETAVGMANLAANTSDFLKDVGALDMTPLENTQSRIDEINDQIGVYIDQLERVEEGGSTARLMAKDPESLRDEIGLLREELDMLTKRRDLLRDEQELEDMTPIQVKPKQDAAYVNPEFDRMREQAREQIMVWGDLGSVIMDAEGKLVEFGETGEREMTVLDEELKAWTGTFASQLTDMVWESEYSFDRIAESFGKMITRMVIQQSALKAFSAAGFDFSGGTGGGGAAQAKGGVWSGGVQEFAQGGMVHSTTPFAMANGGVGVMGERGTEAIMPVTRTKDGDLGVKSEGGGREVKINVTNINRGGEGEMQTDTEEKSDGTVEIRTLIDGEIGRSIRNGAGRDAIQSTFGIKPSGTRRS